MAVDTVIASRQTDVYVGPRPFETGERLFGRDREITALTSLLIGERIALLYSPSGAGKTSLIQAGLVPMVRNEEFLIPSVGPDPSIDRAREKAVVIRVNIPLPAGVPADTNRYLLSTLLSLEDHRPKAERRSARELTRFTLKDYLAGEFPTRPSDPDEPYRPLVLIFDQFEELLTLDPTDVAAKSEFLSQVRDALRESSVQGQRGQRRWALFAMREDHIAGLEPYLSYFPTHLAARYRLDRLSPVMAREAIVEPAKSAGVTFDADAADELIRDLTQIRLQQEDGSFVNRFGPHVEPVHLQVVCRSLWEGKRAVVERISSTDLAALGKTAGGASGSARIGVDAVLGRYYAERVAAAAVAGKVGERRVRDWFDKELITAADARKPVQRGEELKFNITPECMQVLDRAYLVRSDARGGAIWFELAHDRLIAPIRRDNARWRRDNLNDVQKRAEQWQDTGQPDQLLPAGKELDDAERWAADRKWALTETEKRFLTRGREKQDQREAEARAAAKYRKKMLTVIGICAFILSFGLLVTMFLVGMALAKSKADSQAEKERHDLETANQIAIEQEKATANIAVQKAAIDAAQQLSKRNEAQSDLRGRLLKLQTNPPFNGRESLDDAVSALKFAQQNELDTTLAEAAVRSASRSVAWNEIPTLSGPARVVAYSQDGKWFAAGFDEGRFRLWQTDSRQFPEREPRVFLLPVAGGKGGGGGGGGSGGGGGGKSGDQKGIGPRTVTALAFHPTLPQIVVGAEDGGVSIYATDRDSPLATYRIRTSESRPVPVRRIIFSSDGQYMYSTHGDGSLYLVVWPDNGVFATETMTPKKLTLKNLPITTSTFTPLPRKLYAGASDGTVWYWDTKAADEPKKVNQIDAKSAVSALAVTPDATMFAVGTVAADVSIFVMSPISKMLQPGRPYELGNYGVQLLAFSSDSLGGNETEEQMGWLAALTIDGRVRLWKRKDFGTGGLNSPLRGGDAVRAADLALSPKGADGKCRWLLVGGIDGTGRLWDLQDTQTAPAALTGHASAVIDVGFSPNGQWAVTTALDGRARFWDMNVFAQGVRAEPATFSFSRSAPPSTAISADGQFIAMASNTQVQLTNIDGRSRCWDAAGPDGVVSAIRFGATNRELVTAASDGTLTRWELSETAPTVVSRETKMIDRIPDSSSCFAMNGGALIAGEDAWLLVGRKQPVRLQASTTPTQPLVPSAGGRFLTTVEAKQVTIWQIDPEYSKLSQSRVFTKQDFQTQKEAVVADVSADGRLVAIGFADGTIGLYPLEGKNGKTEIGHGEMIRSVRFSPDGSRLATAAADGSLRLWNLTGGLDRARSMNLVGHNRQIRSIDFSADGRALLTVSDDGTIKVWSVTLERLLERAEALLRER